jgi:hypothetical protein
MKTMKLTSVALALLAAALFTTSAHAATAGDLILGVYDDNTSGTGTPVTNSYELDLGSFSTVTASTDTFTIGSSLASVFSSDTSANLVFNIAADGGTSTNGSGGLLKNEVALTSPVGIIGTTNTAVTTNITAEVNNYSSANATPLTDGISIANSSTGAFEKEETNNAGSYGLGGGDPGYVLSPYSAVPVDLYSLTSGALSTPTLVGTFVFSGSGATTTLTYDPLALSSTPEPSTYALMVGGLLTLWALKRRRSNA